MDAFDADALIYAGTPGHPLGAGVRALFEHASAGVGSVLLSPELLIKPARIGDARQLDALTEILGRLDLRPVDASIVESALAVGVAYGLKVVDAVHLATAIEAGADRFITNNSRDFPKSIAEIDVTYPSDL